ncbi:MAG: hypothetical protein K2N51_09635 [Lachnospiraceae bacterium]|nr:hypothetical protein [Lachnospiraceae bacterium]
MPDEQFYNENSHALKTAAVETRNGIPALAVQILASKVDLSTISYDDAIKELYEIVSGLQTAYHQADISD